MSWQRILGVFFRYFYIMRKGLHHLSDLFYWPFIDILIWGLTSIWIQSQTYQVHNTPLILMTALIFWQTCWRGSTEVSISLLQEFWQRNLVNLFSTPLTFVEWILGTLLLSLFKLLITVAFGALTVYFLYSLNVFMIGWYFLPFAILLYIFGWSIAFLSSSAIIYWGHSVEMFAWMLGWIFAPFSAVFFPVDVLPAWAQIIAWCLPTTYIFEGMRAILHTGSFPLSYFWMSLALNIVYLIGTLFLFNRMFQKSRQKGLARLE